MKKTDREELRTLSVEELQTRIESGRRELLQGRFTQVTDGKRRDSSARNTRRGIARMLTVIQEKRGEGQA